MVLIKYCITVLSDFSAKSKSLKKEDLGDHGF